MLICRHRIALVIAPLLINMAGLTERHLMLKISGCSTQATCRGRRHRTLPHGASRDGSAAITAAAGSGFARHRALPPRTFGRFRIIGHRKHWRDTMPGAGSMGHPIQQFIDNADKTTITHACRSPFARPSNFAWWSSGRSDNDWRRQR
jgi:hypothetical protein